MFVVTAGEDSFTKNLSVMVCVWFVTHHFSAGKPEDLSFQSVSLDFHSQMALKLHSVYIGNAAFHVLPLNSLSLTVLTHNF